MSSEFWWTEYQTLNYGITFRVKSILKQLSNEFAELVVFDTYEFGRVLALDGAVQFTEKDEYFYHETMAHTAIAYASHLEGLNVLIIGGGDLGIARELLKYPVETVATVTVVDINPAVTDIAREFFPALFDVKDARLTVIHTDALDYVHSIHFDVAIVDSTDPVGPAVGLFGKSFVKNLQKGITGPIIVQTCSPLFHPNVLEEMVQIGKQLDFPVVQPLIGTIPTYPAIWSYCLLAYSAPLELPQQLPIGLKYFNQEVFKALHALPNFFIS